MNLDFEVVSFISQFIDNFPVQIGFSSIICEGLTYTNYQAYYSHPLTDYDETQHS